MQTSESFKDFVLDQLNACGSGCSFHARKMFGDYCVYVHKGSLPPRPAFLLCSETLFVKKYNELLDLCRDCESGFAYEGAKESFILDIENPELLKEVISVLDRILPPPKAKKSHNKENETE